MSEITGNSQNPIKNAVPENSARENLPGTEVPANRLGRWWQTAKRLLSFGRKEVPVSAPVEPIATAAVPEATTAPVAPTYNILDEVRTIAGSTDDVGKASTPNTAVEVTPPYNILDEAKAVADADVPLDLPASAPDIHNEVAELLKGPLATEMDKIRLPAVLSIEEQNRLIADGAHYFEEAVKQKGINKGKFAGFRLADGSMLNLNPGRHNRYEIGPALLHKMAEMKANEKNPEYIEMISREEARLGAFLEGYGDRAATEGDFLTAFATFDVLLPGGSDNPAMQEKIREWEQNPDNVKLIEAQKARYEEIKKRRGGTTVLDRAQYP